MDILNKLRNMLDGIHLVFPRRQGRPADVCCGAKWRCATAIGGLRGRTTAEGVLVGKSHFPWVVQH